MPKIGPGVVSDLCKTPKFFWVVGCFNHTVYVVSFHTVLDVFVHTLYGFSSTHCFGFFVPFTHCITVFCPIHALYLCFNHTLLKFVSFIHCIGVLFTLLVILSAKCYILYCICLYSILFGVFTVFFFIGIVYFYWCYIYTGI